MTAPRKVCLSVWHSDTHWPPGLPVYCSVDAARYLYVEGEIARAYAAVCAEARARDTRGLSDEHVTCEALVRLLRWYSPEAIVLLAEANVAFATSRIEAV